MYEIMADVLRIGLESTAVINVLLSVVIIFAERRDPRIVWAWLLVLNLIPVIGFLLYLLIGMDFYKNRLFRVKEIEDEMRKLALKQEKLINKNELEVNGQLLSNYKDLVLYNLEVSDAVLTNNNVVNIISDGKEKFHQLLEDIRNAKEYIHIQYYIIQKDDLWFEISRELIKKAQKGVHVRVLFDGMGSRKMGASRWNMLRTCGIHVGEFFPPVLGRLHFRINYRNHRKIVVIDGRLAYVGGFNIGREYLGKVQKYGYWRDTHLRIEGAAVTTLAVRFALDWNYATNENLFLKNDLFKLPEYESHGDIPVQIISSGPDSTYQQIRDNYLYLIHRAKSNVYIQTPYFVPDEAILTALQVASKSGVEIRIMIPCKPDHPLVYWATFSYIGELLKSGARCFIYNNGFLHAKTLSIDGDVCCCGTANMDIRSFKLNFEVNAVVYNEEFTKKMDTLFLEDLEQCTEITLEDYDTRSLWVRYKEGFSRLFSPVL